MAQYWHGTCPVCKQGRLFVMVRSDDRTLFLECEECYSGWTTPEKVSSAGGGFLGIEIDSDFATLEQMNERGWPAHGLQQG
jgi:hypothetical protein